ncbi:hypothetical protein HK405_010422 [Cladochytrium tenue]|nr:hypothetical protein HK405_010422 [Cladochytrium tenue]
MSRTELRSTASSAADSGEPPHPVADITLAAPTCTNPSPLARSVSSATAVAAALASSLLESSAAALADAVRSSLQPSPTPPTDAADTDAGTSPTLVLSQAVPLPLFSTDSPQLLPTGGGAGDTGGDGLEEQPVADTQLETRLASGSTAAAAAATPGSVRVDYLAAARAAFVRVVVLSDGFESGDDLRCGGGVGEPTSSAIAGAGAATARRWHDDGGMSDAGWSTTTSAAAAASTLGAGCGGGNGYNGVTDEAAAALLELEDTGHGGGAQRNLTAAQRARLFHRIFRSVPEDEPLVKDHICAFQREMILQQGKMYLTPHHICFFANILGYQTKIVIPLETVLSIERAKTAMIIPNAIEINTMDRSHFFTSFISREAAFANLQLLLSRHRHGVGGAPPFPFLSSAASSRQNSDSSFADADATDATGPKPLGTARRNRAIAAAMRFHRSSLPPPTTGSACSNGIGGGSSWGRARSPSPPTSPASPKYARHSLVGTPWTAADRLAPVGSLLSRQSGGAAAASNTPSSSRPSTPAFLVPAMRAVSAATLSDRACDADSDTGGGSVVRARALHIGGNAGGNGGGSPTRRPTSAPPPSSPTTASPYTVGDRLTATPHPLQEIERQQKQQQQHGQQQHRQRGPAAHERPLAAAASPHRPSSAAVAVHTKLHEHARWRRNVGGFGHVARGSSTSQSAETLLMATHGVRGRTARPAAATAAAAAAAAWLVLLACVVSCVVLAIASTAVVWRLQAMVGRLEEAAAVLGAVPMASDGGLNF